MPSKLPIDFRSKIRQKRKKNEKASRHQCFNQIISPQKSFQMTNFGTGTSMWKFISYYNL